jgi:hypothetical protein
LSWRAGASASGARGCLSKAKVRKCMHAICYAIRRTEDTYPVPIPSEVRFAVAGPGGLYEPRFSVGLGLPGIPILRVVSNCGFAKFVRAIGGAFDVGFKGPSASRLIGCDFV